MAKSSCAHAHPPVCSTAAATAHHTPGPWQALNWVCHAATTIKAGDIVVAECSGFGRYADESLADARLIASAPELLRACVQMLERSGSEYWPIEQEMARAAIAKAMGGAA